MKRSIKSFFAFALIAASAAGLYNVMADNTEVRKLAEELACEGNVGSSCRAQMTFMERSPIGQTFEFATAKKTVRVKCARAFIFVGDYACKLP